MAPQCETSAQDKTAGTAVTPKNVFATDEPSFFFFFNVPDQQRRSLPTTRQDNFCVHSSRFQKVSSRCMFRVVCVVALSNQIITRTRRTFLPLFLYPTNNTPAPRRMHVLRMCVTTTYSVVVQYTIGCFLFSRNLFSRFFTFCPWGWTTANLNRTHFISRPP